MAIRQILHEGDPTLRKKAKAVELPSPRISALAEDMIDTLAHTGNGIGLAAPQIGVLRRLFVIDMQEGDGPIVFVNPEILETKGKQCGTEGCLSLPGLWGEVERPAWVRCRAQNLDGSFFELTAEGLFAVCICHEYDHLEGVLFRDRAIHPLESTP